MADFGLARSTGIPVKNYTNEVVTLWYRAPDVLLGSTNYSFTIDVWSIGCIMAELILMKPLFMGKNEKEQIDVIFKIMGTPTEEQLPLSNNLTNWKPQNFTVYEGKKLSDVVPRLDAQGYDLLAQLLSVNPSKRITAKNALNHPWFADLPDKIRNMQ